MHGVWSRSRRCMAVLALLPAFTAGCQGPAEPDRDSAAGRASEPTPPPSQPTGAIQVATVTVGGGLDADFNRYTVKIGRERVAAVGPTSSTLIGGLTEGTYIVELVDLQTCQVLGSNPRRMTVVPFEVTRETFRVHC